MTNAPDQPTSTEASEHQRWQGASQILLGLAAIAASLPFVITASGSIRAVTGLSPDMSLWILLPSWPLLLWWIGRWTWRARQAWPVLLLQLVIIIPLEWMLFSQLFNPYLGGMPNGFSPDAGNHGASYFDCLRTNAAYDGQVGTYQLLYWYRKLPHRTLFEGFRFIFYFIVFSVPVLLQVVADALGEWDPRSRANCLVTLTLGILAFPTLFYFFSPLLGYYQLDGFYTQLWGLLPLLAVWLFYSFVERWPWRLAGCLMLLGILRYTYALNLGDLCIALACLVVLDAWAETRGVASAVALGCAALLVGVGEQVLVRLYPLTQQYSTTNWPRMLPFESDWIRTFQLLVSLFLVGFVAFARSDELALSPRALRLIRFAGLFGFVNWLVQFAYLFHGYEATYYPRKYDMAALVVLSLVAIPMAAIVIVRTLSDRERPTWRRSLKLTGGLFVVMVLAAASAVRAMTTPLELAEERAHGSPPFKVIFPLFDQDLEKQFRHVLVEHGAEFGGYFHRKDWFPQFLFANTNHDRGAMHFVSYLSNKRPFPIKPGRCYFWTHPLQMPYQAEVEELQSLGTTECQEFHSRLDPPQNEDERLGDQLCWLCLEPGDVPRTPKSR